MSVPEQGPVLQGLKVLDLTRLLPGPLCTMLMGDYGADVIKVEEPLTGDPTRAVGKPDAGSGAFFRSLNRNKRSLAVNLKTGQGREILSRLAAQSDVLVEGFRPGVMERLKLGYRELSAVNPALVYASISGYGQDGPYRERAGHDINYTAVSGLLDLSAAPGEGPVMPAVQIADIAGGSLSALSGIMMALFARQKSGRGAHVDISMTRGLLPWLATAAACLEGGEALPRRGKGLLTGAYACYNIYETLDGGHMSLGALEPSLWQNFCLAVGRPDWVPLQFDPAEQEKLGQAVRGLFRQKTRAQWTKIFDSHDACCEPVLELREAAAHPLARAQGFWTGAARHGELQALQHGFPLFFSGAGGAVRCPPPALGEHTFEILKSLGYTDEAIAALKQNGEITC